MAIGDTVQAGLLKADFSPIERGGAAKGRAYRAIGEGIGSALDKFAKNKQEGEAAEMGINAMIAGMDDKQKEELLSGETKLGKTYNKFLDGELSNSQKKAFLGGLATYNTTYRQNMADQMALDKFAIERAKARRDAIRFNTDQQNEISENQFLQTLPSLITNPQAQRQADIARPGLPALGNADTRNRFLQSQLDDPRNQVPVMNLNDRDFLNQFKDDPQQIKRALAFIEKRRENQKPQKIARTITVEDGQGGFTQIGVDEAGNPVRDFGPPKPSGMYPTPEEQAKGKEDILSVENANDFVNKTRENSLESAKSIRPATRALTLLEKGDLDTGGITELKTNTIAMLDSLGIPIDKETMDKVANTQNFRAEVGKFLFENISNTKGSISEKEMDIFAKISPGLQMTPEANKVLLQYVIKKAERDKDRVKFIQDMRRKGVSIVEQRNRLEDYMIENDLSEVLSPIAGQPSEQTPQNTFNLNGQNVLGEVVGTKPNGDKLIKVNGQIFVQPAQ